MTINRITVKLQKTIQERQYEPIVFGVELEANLQPNESVEYAAADLYIDAHRQLTKAIDRHFETRAKKEPSK